MTTGLLVRGTHVTACLLWLLWGSAPLPVQAQCGRRGPTCPNYDPQPTALPNPDTIWYPSPNFGGRNYLQEIDSIVIHTTEGTLQDGLDWLSTRISSVSAHFVIAPDGDIFQMVDLKDRAWHATSYNDRSIGIEMVGESLRQSTWNQDNLSSLVELLAWLLQAYPHIPLTHPPGTAYDYPSNAFNAPGLVRARPGATLEQNRPRALFPLVAGPPAGRGQVEPPAGAIDRGAAVARRAGLGACRTATNRLASLGAAPASGSACRRRRIVYGRRRLPTVAAADGE